MTRLSQIEWDRCLVEPVFDGDFEQRFRRETGRPGGNLEYLTGAPWLREAIIRLSVELPRHIALDADLADLAGLVVSQDNSCRYCFATLRLFLMVLGMPAEKISRLEQQLLTVDFDPAERAALDFARRVSRSDPLPTSADVEKLRAHGYSDLQIVELVGVIGGHTFFNRLATLIAMPAERVERLPESLRVRLFRPLVKLRLRGIRRIGSQQRLEPGEADGPWAHVVRGLDGLPLARVLRTTVDEMLGSEILTRRCKLLVLAVVARALACPKSEQEARRLLAGEGLAESELEEILAHLASPCLDAVEQVVVPFARETVWYTPIQIQRRGREIMKRLSRDQFLELVGVASLANLLCRASIVTQVSP